MTEDQMHRSIKNQLCAICGESPAECIADQSFAIHRQSLDEWVADRLLENSGEPAPARPAMVNITVPCCGDCYEQVSNAALDRDFNGGGYDFRQMYDCKNPFHDGDTQGGVPSHSAGGWTAYVCPDPKCTAATTKILNENDPRTAGHVLFAALSERFRDG